MPERRDIFVLEVCVCEFQNMRNDQVYFETLLPVTDSQPQREKEREDILHFASFFLFRHCLNLTQAHL